MTERPSRFGALRQLRTTPEPETPPDTPESPQAPDPAPAAPRSRARRPQPASEAPAATAGQGKVGRPPGKRSNAEYRQVSALVRRDTYKATQRRLLDEEGRDFSELVDALLGAWLRGQVKV